MDNKKQKIVLGGVFVALILFGATFAAAQNGVFRNSVSGEEKLEIREAFESGDYETWRALMVAQLSEERFNEMRQRYESMLAHKAEVDAALEAGDYGAWLEAVNNQGRNPKVTEVITEDNFETLVEMHEAKELGDYQTVKELAEELGFDRGMGHGKRHNGFKN